MLINELSPQMFLKTSPYVETLYARANRAEKRDGSALNVYISLVQSQTDFKMKHHQYWTLQNIFNSFEPWPFAIYFPAGTALISTLA